MIRMIKKTDAQLQRDVLQELRWDPQVNETDIGVAVDLGVVTLTGTVDSWTASLAAREAAHRVPGVLDVADEVHVKLPGSHERTDTDIAQAVRSALEWDVRLPQERIHSTVSEGIVILEGGVDLWSQHAAAASAVRDVAGVREVKNQIAVEPVATLAPESVRATIESVLARHATEHIQIVMADGRVILSGEVPSSAERAAAEGAVRNTPGVREVANQLRIAGETQT